MTKCEHCGKKIDCACMVGGRINEIAKGLIAAAAKASKKGKE